MKFFYSFYKNIEIHKFNYASVIYEKDDQFVEFIFIKYLSSF